MSTIKKTSAKNANLETINLSKFQKSLENFEVKEKGSKSLLYIYPENFSANDINSDKGKTFRSNKRNSLKRFSDNILSYTKQNNTESLLSEVAKFKVWYKEFFVKNDFTLNSLSHKKEDAKNSDTILMLEIIKSLETVTPAKKVKAKK